ncbi:MAG: radical SAM protein [Phycisphaerae bacterium]
MIQPAEPNTSSSHPPRREDASYTAPGDHTTAAAIGKQYLHEFLPSQTVNKSAARSDDGRVTSAAHARNIAVAGQDAPEALRIDFHHPLERWLARRPFRWLLGRLAKVGSDGRTALERIITSYRNPAAPRWQRVKYWLFHLFIDRMRGDVDADTFRRKLAEHAPTVRGLVIVARSISEFGLTVPQKFSAPLFAVWNFTNRCNLACKHCYQDSQRKSLADELTLDEKLDLVDQMGAAHMPMLAISGGEPTLSPDLVPVLERGRKFGMHLTIATNGTTMTRDRAAELAAAGLRYVEISLDSVHPERHDAFRGAPGLWQRTVEGMKNVVATPGLRLGIAMCVHQGNFAEVCDMIAFARDIGAGCFAHFNFIPVGRGLKMVSGDITPRQREELLAILNEEMQKGGLGIISTAPQLGRVCLAGPAVGELAGTVPRSGTVPGCSNPGTVPDRGTVPKVSNDKVSCSHAGSGSGMKARVVAKYLGGCGAGRTYVCIEPNGNVTPCVYLPHRVMGNLRQRPLMDIYRSSIFWVILNDRTRRLHHCEVCAFRNYCGGCRARADAYFGQLHAGDPGCIFNEKHWDKLVEDGVAVTGDPAGPADEIQITATRHGPA